MNQRYALTTSFLPTPGRLRSALGGGRPHRATIKIVVVGAIILGAVLTSARSFAQAPTASSIFSLKTDDFWLSLHQFLYVLGRAQAGEEDAARAAVSQAPVEAERIRKTITAQERQAWSAAVTTYATTLSLKDPVSDDLLIEIGHALAASEDMESLPKVGINPAVRQTLESVAAIYRKAWWPSHRLANRAWKTSMEPLLEQHGPAILSFITHAYDTPWPAEGYPVHLVTYATWAGAFSTVGKLLVVSTNSKGGTEGLLGLELLFHESMHQWDQEMQKAIREQADRIGKRVTPEVLSHALIWITAGEAVKHVVPTHVPCSEVFGIWRGENEPLRIPLQKTWVPYLAGHGTRAEALAAVMEAIPAEPSLKTTNA